MPRGSDGPQAPSSFILQWCQSYPGFPSPNQVPFISEFACTVLFSDHLTRQEFPLAWMAEDLLILGQGRLCQLCLCCVPEFILPKVCNFLHGWPICKALAVSHISPGTLHLTAQGRLGSSSCSAFTFRPEPRGLFIKHYLLAKQEPGLWGSEEH